MKLSIIVLFSILAMGISQLSYLTSASYSPCKNCCSANTLTTSGSATVTAPPDKATINVQITTNGKTSNEALNNLATQINKVTAALLSNGLNSNNWKTTSLNVYANNSYVNGTTIYYGQIASQSLEVTIPIIGNGANVGKVFDSLAAINQIQVNGLSYGLDNQTQYLNSARTQAYNNAYQKAVDYTGALSMNLGGVITITDSYSTTPTPTPGPYFLKSAAMEVSTPTTVSIGSVSVSYNVNVVYSIS
jgi:hypothetical protein